MPQKVNRWLVAFVISLCLNLFLIGFGVARRHMMMDRERDPWAAGMQLGPRGFMRHAGLPVGNPELRRVLQAQRGALRDRMQNIVQARRAARDALLAEPYDEARLRAALDALQTQSAQMQLGMHQTLLQLAHTLSPEERRRLAHAPFMDH